jgi:hypothetical protein
MEFEVHDTLYLDALQKNDRSLVVDSSGFSTTQWKYDDLKSWIWLQKAIHPELDYDLKKKWVSERAQFYITIL